MSPPCCSSVEKAPYVIVTQLVDVTLASLALITAVPAIMFCCQIFGSIIDARTPRFSQTLPSFAVVVPAHNESATIRRTIASIRSQLPPGGRLLVVADNCTDDTAQLACLAGAEFTERRDPMKVGKGYALDHGVRMLATSNPPEVVIFIDADCDAGPQALDTIARLSAETGRPVQAQYIMRSSTSATAVERLSQFAWRVKTLLRPMGSKRLGLPCPLLGTGMALPWSVIDLVDLATGHIAEDMKLTADLALIGKAPVFCQYAYVSSCFPTGVEAKREQRTRWEQGHLAIISEYFWPLLTYAISAKSLPMFAFVMDLCMPPLSLMISFMILMECAVVCWFVLTGQTMAFAISSAALMLLGISTVLAWWRIGRDIVFLRDILAAPFYCASKFPSLVRLFTKGRVEWTRTERS